MSNYRIEIGRLSKCRDGTTGWNNRNPGYEWAVLVDGKRLPANTGWNYSRDIAYAYAVACKRRLKAEEEK